MTETWGPWRDLVRRLEDTRSCPACGTVLAGSVCGVCHLDLSVERAHDVLRLSVEAADALRRRAEVITTMRADQETARRDRVAAPAVADAPPGRAPSTGSRPPSAPVRTLSPVRPPARAPRRPPAARPRRPRGAPVSLQPILAGAGATLLAVAAVVFVFFTFGDDLALRAVVTGIVTTAAATVAALLRRGGLRTTSEAVAALAAVLCWVDVELAMQAGLLGGLHPALARAVVLAVLAPAFVAVGHRLRVRTWVSAGLVAALAVPPSAAAGLPSSAWTAWWWALACLLTGGLAVAAAHALPLLARRLRARFVPEARALRVVRAAAVPAALLAASVAPATPVLTSGGATATLWCAVVLVALPAGLLLRVRSWVTAGVLAAPVLPPLAATSVPASPGTAWWWTGACVLAAAVAAGRSPPSPSCCGCCAGWASRWHSWPPASPPPRGR